ncbi:testis-specific gene 10 protein [Spea bombifrons]|uniref:testis-specific gene 10 protein n=1 Tax=Spea bombifrons TaxID=233779 RepID=UPI00234B4C47|nr:testis-specific gene 10 protein [Spea bombifrons]
MASKSRAGSRAITELQIKIDELQNTNRGLEQHILHLQEDKELVSDQVDVLTRKNEQLCSELTELDQLAEQLEKGKKRDLDAAEQELQDTKSEIRRQQKTIADLELLINNVKLEADMAKEHLGKAEMSLKEQKEENRTLNVLLDQLQEDKDRLTKKLEKAEKTEKNNVLAKEKSKAMAPSKLDAFVKTLEEERDHYKREAENMRKMLRGRSRSPKRITSQLDSELGKILKERDAIQAMLEKYERHMAEIQGNVKVLTSERDKTIMLYEKAQQEIAQLRRELLKSPKTPKTSLTAQSILRRVESERDSAISDLRRMTTERDSLRERLKISQETAINDRAHLEQSVEELQCSIRIVEDECVEHKCKLSALKETVCSLENEIKITTRRAMEAEHELMQRKSELDSLRLLNEKTEQSLEETQRRLSMKLSELELAQEKTMRLENKIGEQTSQNLSQREEISVLKATISQLDSEKDSLTYSFDQKTETISSLEKSIAFKETTIQNLRKELGEVESSARQSAMILSSQEQDISRLRRQMDEISDELSRTGRDREQVAQENIRLQEQLSKSKTEMQAQSHKLKDCQSKLEDVTLKLQDALTNVARLENTVGSKEKENRDLLDNYRSATSQAESWEKNFHQAESECRSVKLELLNAESERRRYKERAESLEAEIEQHLTSEQSYKSRINSLTKAISRMEEELQQMKGEKASVLSDLASTRELCVKLDSGKEFLNRQLCSKSQDMERLQCELETSRSETELLRKQLASERISIKNLESLLASNQEKEYQTHLRAEELGSELQLLTEKLILAESKLETQSRESSQLRNRITQQDTELEITRRHLSTEQFERQRAVKELRRQTYPHQASSSLRSSLSPSRASPNRFFRSPERLSRSPVRNIERSSFFRDF